MSNGLPLSNLLPDLQWQQVMERDAAADGQFVYAVRSTKIYCRPSCPSRRPVRDSVLFFSTPDEARHAGFRACKRCKPDAISLEPDAQTRAVADVTRYLKGRDAESISLHEVAKETGHDTLTIHRGFKRVLGVSPAKYAKAQRLESFKQSVRQPAHSITDAIYEAGYGSSSRLYEASQSTLGMTPRTMRKGGVGLRIRYCTATTPLGRMLVATTEIGVCSITFGENDTQLIAALQKDFHRAELIHEEKETGWLAEAVAFVVSQLSEHPLAANFPLDVRATAFQLRVWRALQEIPRGKTLSYSELAESIGSPTAVRAVAGACGANRVAIAVPCHRIVGKDGSLTGYRWGVERKRRLLAAEEMASD